jgi:hypothetical protein
MLRNAVIHIANEQPIMADLVAAPSPSDGALICRNMRTMNGSKPIWVDHADSTFVLPLGQIRFVEIPAIAFQEAGLAGDEILRPVASLLPIAAADTAPSGEDGAAGNADGSIVDLTALRGEEGLDGDLLRRIREA